MDIVKFFIVYCLVLFAFACGLNQLFWYYATMRSNECHQAREAINDPSKREQMEQWEKSCEPRFSSFGKYASEREILLRHPGLCT